MSFFCHLVDCDFNDDSCGWSSETADGYDKHVWLKASRTASSGTGPSTDHGTGRGNTLYLSLERMVISNRFAWVYYYSGISDRTVDITKIMALLVLVLVVKQIVIST